MVTVRKLGLIGLGMFSFGLMSTSWGFWALIKWVTMSQCHLKKNGLLRRLWEDIPIAFDFNIYIFNVTNPDDVISGGKPILQEVGPFHYDVYRSKKNLVDREEDDSVEYSSRQVWYFNEKMSIMSEDAEIYTIHPLILVLALIVNGQQSSAMGVVNKAVDSIFDKPESIFIKTSVKELFFHGLRIDCKTRESAGKFVCNLLKRFASDILVQEEESVYRFGFAAKLNGTIQPSRIRISRGIKNHLDIGRLISIDNKTKHKVWSRESCNSFRGTDGSIVSPFVTPDRIIWIHSADICRNFAIYYVEPSITSGFKTMRFSVDLLDPFDNDTNCYCSSSKCIRNLYNVKPCQPVPIVLSLPHFYDSDPQFVEMVEGLKPSREKHMIHAELDELTSAPLIFHLNIQFNFFVEPISKFKLMESFPEMLFPFFWIQDGIDLRELIHKPLTIAHRLMFLMHVIFWLMMLAGIGMMVAAIGMQYMKPYELDFPTTPKMLLLSPARVRQKKEQPLFRKITVGHLHPAVVPPNLDY